jgi:flagellar hook-basal body complex protein FliE
MREKMIRGELQNTMHEASIAGMKAGLMLKMTTAICSKVSSACTTLFQMQIYKYKELVSLYFKKREV